MTMRLAVLLAIVTVTPACHAAKSGAPSTFQCGGETLAQDWKIAARDIEDKEDARKLADAIFCAPETGASEALLRSHLDANVLTVTSSTGEQEERVAVPREKLDRLPMFNAAPDRQFHIRADNAKLVLEASNESCLDTVTLVRNRTWVVTEYDSACD